MRLDITPFEAGLILRLDAAAIAFAKVKEAPGPAPLTNQDGQTLQDRGDLSAMADIFTRMGAEKVVRKRKSNGGPKHG